MYQKRIKGLWIIPVVWMGVIFMFSHQPGEESAQLSGGIVEFVVETLDRVGIETQGLKLHQIIRGLAHCTVFFVLGILWYGTLINWSIIPQKAMFITLSIGTGYAIFDELHQLFIPGRACDIYDVMIDVLGVILAIGIGRLVTYRLDGRQRANT